MIEEPPKLIIRRAFPRPTQAQIDAFARVQTGFLCDAMGGSGAMAPVIQPMGGGGDLPPHAHGPAVVADNGPAEYLATMGAMHICQPGDIIVAAVAGHMGAGVAGDQICGIMRNCGCAAFVTDGPVRDHDGIVAAGLPVWCAGLSPNSPFSNGPGRAGFGAVVGGRQVDSGDMVVADRDGVVVVPFAQIDAVIAQLDAIRGLEAELEAKVKAGLSDMGRISAMLENGSAVFVD